MIRVISQNSMGKSERGWLHSTFHFSFAEYYNPENIQFGALRVLNDDIFDAGNGFPTHPHQNMEIITYVVEGTLTHQDSLGNQRTVTRGQVQYMSAGTGVRHSEYNLTKDPLRILQIWIRPDKNGYTPSYGDMDFPWEQRVNRWLPIVSGDAGTAPIKIHQDMNLLVAFLEEGKELTYPCKAGRQLYLVQIEGSGSVNGKPMQARDGAEITQEENVVIRAEGENAHYILFDMVAVF